MNAKGEAFAAALREVLATRRMSAGVFANAVNIHRSTANAIVNGLALPTPELAHRMEEGLHLSLQEKKNLWRGLAADVRPLIVSAAGIAPQMFKPILEEERLSALMREVLPANNELVQHLEQIKPLNKRDAVVSCSFRLSSEENERLKKVASFFHVSQQAIARRGTWAMVSLLEKAGPFNNTTNEDE